MRVRHIEHLQGSHARFWQYGLLDNSQTYVTCTLDRIYCFKQEDKIIHSWKRLSPMSTLWLCNGSGSTQPLLNRTAAKF